MTKALSDASTGREWLLIGLITLAGGLIRLAGLGQAGLTHFDEGIYALAGGWGFQKAGLAAIDPGLIPYSPPVYVILVGEAYQFLGASDASAILVSILTSTLSLPAIGWIGRQTFGPGAGAASAAIAALAVPHVVFARMALTDATFLLTWLLAWCLAVFFLRGPGLWSAIGLGAAVGLAQLTKYNGWIEGGIVAAAAVVSCLVEPEARTRSRLTRVFGFGLLAAVVAALVYAPWYLFVERHGGYASLLQHQRGYLGDWTSWPRNLFTQWSQEIALSGGVGWRSAGLVLAAGCLFSLGLNPARKGMARLVPFAIAGLLAFVSNAGWWVGLVGSAFWIRSTRVEQRLLAVGWLVVAILTPFYHPYARLWLPVEAFGWVGLGGILAELQRLDLASISWTARRRAVAFLALPAALGLASFRPGTAQPNVLGPTDSLRLAVNAIVQALPNDGRPVRVLARPPVLFYASGRANLQRLPDLSALNVSVSPGTLAIIDEIQVAQEPEGPAKFAEIQKDWRVLKQEVNVPGWATRLDIDPSRAASIKPPASYRLFLLEYAPGQAQRPTQAHKD